MTMTILRRVRPAVAVATVVLTMAAACVQAAETEGRQEQAAGTAPEAAISQGQQKPAAEQELTPETIRKTKPDLYRKIQAGPKLPPEVCDPEKPYETYPGFFAQPVLKPGQIEEWWETSSFDYSPVYPYLLKHTHMKFSYSNSEGNDRGWAFKGGLLLALRKSRFTNVNGYEIDKKHINSSDETSRRDIQNFEETALYELNRYLFVEGGTYWQRLSPQRIQSRLVPFIGLGSYNVLQDLVEKRRTRLALNLGFGWVDDEYDGFIKSIIHKDGDSFKALYGKAFFSHKFTDTLTYRQSFIIKHAIDRTTKYGITTIPQTSEQRAIVLGSTRRYDWLWNNTLEFALNQYVGFLVSYEVRFDSNPWPTVLKRDTEFLTGFKFAY